ncbi:MAG: DUF3276 family protein [Chitinophagaceae bacterium]
MSSFYNSSFKKPNQFIVLYDNNDKRQDSVYSKRIKAGKRRTYFFDIKPTRSNDYYLTITESRKRFNEDGYDRHKIFVYKEDFNKFIEGLTDALDYVKTQLMPDFDFDAYSHEYDDEYREEYSPAPTATIETAPTSESTEAVASHTTDDLSSERVDEW